MRGIWVHLLLEINGKLQKYIIETTKIKNKKINTSDTLLTNQAETICPDSMIEQR